MPFTHQRIPSLFLLGLLLVGCELINPTGENKGTCGNGMIESREECDDGNQDDNDACSNACTIPDCHKDGGVKDCGGPCADKCEDGQSCKVDADCKGGACHQNVCSGGPKTCEETHGSQGCCAGNILYFFANGVVNRVECFDSCSWLADKGTYACSGSGAAEPSGKFPLKCGGPSIPDVVTYCDSLGKGGAAGSAGTGGAGTAGVAGASGEAGAGGDSGAAGASGASGGSAGSQAGGSGGGATCGELLPGDDACGQCMVSQCCAEVEACGAKQECKDCIFSTSPECDSPTSEIRACLQNKCPEACGNAGAGGAAGASGAAGNAGAGAGGSAGSQSGGSGGSAGQQNNCCTVTLGVPGCANATVKDCVCAIDSFCCAIAWDAGCVEYASQFCGACGGGAGGAAGTGGEAGASGATGGGAGNQASGAGGSAGGGTAPNTCEQAHGFVGCCVGNTRYYFDPSTNTIDALKCTDSCGWHADFGGYACGFDGVDPSGKYPLECGGAPIPEVVAECSGSAGAGGSAGNGGAGGSAGGAGGSAGSQASGSGGSAGGGTAPTTCEQAHGVVGCCVDNTNYYTVGFDVTSEACAPGTTCTWDSNAEFYSCGPGPAKADPSGQYPLACGGTTPPDIVAYCSGGVGGMAGAGGAAGSGGAGGYNGIAAPCMGCMAAQCKPVFDACFQDFNCNQCAMFNPSGPGCANDPKFAALKACNCDLCGATDCSSECAAFGGNPGGSGGSAGSGGGAGSGGSGGVSGKIIYLTSSPKKANFGGIPGADAACNANPPQGKVYKALIVDGTSRVACLSPGCNQGGPGEGKDWVLAPNTKYVRVDGTTVIGTTSEKGIFTFPLQASFSTQSGDYWTGLNPDWTSSSDDCKDWGGIVAAFANKGLSGPVDTQAIAGASDSCQFPVGSYFACVEQ